MHALEAEPEKSGRWRRLAAGAALALALGAGTIFLARTVAPNNKLFTSVMKIAIVDSAPPKPKPRDEEPPPPKPLPPKPKPKERPSPEKSAAAPAPSQQPQQEPAEPDIGLDATSFGDGSGGPAFHVGTSQMGVPTGRGSGGAPPPVKVDQPTPELREARPRAGNKQPAYLEKVRRLGIEGLLVIEADVDARGHVVRAVVRRKLEPSLDEEARETVLGWAFEPATLQGRAVPSTKFLRFRFQLQ